MSVTVIENESPSKKEEAFPGADLLMFLGELKALTESLKESLAAMAPTLQEIKAQTTEILSLAETIEETTETIEEATAETESESEEEENQEPEAEVEVIIPPAPIMTEAPPEKPDHPLVSMGRKILLGQSE